MKISLTFVLFFTILGSIQGRAERFPIDPKTVPTTYRSIRLPESFHRQPIKTAHVSSQYLKGLGRPLTTYPPKAGSRVKISVLSRQQISNLFFFFSTRLPFRYAGDCCHSRAQIMSSASALSGLTLAKVFVVGDLKYTSYNLRAKSKEIRWEFHVAPVVLNEAGQFIIIDPATTLTPIPVDQWVSLFSKPSQREVYLAPGETFAPDDIPRISSIQPSALHFASDENQTAELELLGCAAVESRLLRKR